MRRLISIWSVTGASSVAKQSCSQRALAVSFVFVLALAQIASANITEWREVTRVIDGDTLVLDGGERVRLIGVDTPETVHPQKPVEYFGKEASEFTRRAAEGRRVRLEYDQGTGRQDRYGRTLAYVYLEDGRLLNLKIIEGGYGHAYTRFPFAKMEEFRRAEQTARERESGLWGETTNTAHPEPLNLFSERDIAVEGREASCTPRDQCCKVCSKGQACGNSCISRSYTCRKGRGCACNSLEVCR